MNKKTLILTNSQVQRLIDMPQVLKAVENAFILYGKKLVQMPAKIYLDLDKPY
jgi:ornithine cyclodeaminase/alanine dehydrogenase-like protein (mu-crystallin family)